MVEAYILLKMSIQRESGGFARSVVEQVKAVDGVEYADLLFGDYDAVLKLQGNTIHELEELVLEKIAMVHGIQSTVTLLCVDERALIEGC